MSGEYEKESVPGVTWKPSTDGVAVPDQMISRTLESDMIAVRDHLMTIHIIMIRVNTRILILLRTRTPRFLQEWTGTFLRITNLQFVTMM